MRKVGVILGVLAVAPACGDVSQLPTRPSGDLTDAGVPQTAPVSARAIAVGEQVSESLHGHGSFKVFELTAPSDGTLLVQVSWDPGRGSLELWIEDRVSVPTPAGSPIAGTIPVISGRTYRLTVTDHAPWDYDKLSLPFTLTTSIE